MPATAAKPRILPNQPSGPDSVSNRGNKNNGYSIAREYVDEAESGRIADRPQFRKMIDEGSKAKSPFPSNPGMEIQPLHSQAGTRCGLQVHAPAQGHPRRLHH